MEDFIIQNKSFITRIFELLAVLTGLICYKKYRFTNAKYFIYFLIYAFLVDLIGGYPRHFNNYVFLSNFKNIIKDTIFEYNNWWYTLFWDIGAVLFFAFYFNRILNTTLFKRMIKYTSLMFLLFSISYILVYWKIYLFSQSIPIICVLGGFVILFCVILYLLEILQSDKVMSFYKSLNFYISIAIFIWWLIVTPLSFYDIYNSTSDWNFVFLKWQIYLFANIFMYGTFTIGLIVSSPENEKI